MGTAFAYGFGTTINELEQRKDAVNRLFDVFSEKRQKKFVAEWRKNYPQLEWDDALTIMFISEGPEVMLKREVNGQEIRVFNVHLQTTGISRTMHQAEKVYRQKRRYEML